MTQSDERPVAAAPGMAADDALPTPVRDLRRASLVGDAARFSAVGLISYIVDLGIFNLLRVSAAGTVLGGPVEAKTAGVIAATIVAWLGSRYWTFRSTGRRDIVREFVEFIVVSLAGYLVNVIVLAISHYGFGFTSLLADNIAGNVVGAGMGALLRFVLYRRWVYRNDRGAAAALREKVDN
ncbi:GtrA family protein [Curtobacterium ammoniigenes]|uniref:GtrA family protein n=1 Tax=Curtobacterium ammoniigenes TaxID=395387 RepID=UPI00082CD59F|nr:GtrA family protein [Curtobacterium ammoniigenes]